MHRIDIAGMHAVRTASGAGFEMVMKMAVPQGFDLSQLVDELNRVGQEFNITAEASDYK